MLIALRDSGRELSPGVERRRNSLGKAVLHLGESQGWVLACLYVTRSVFSDIVTLRVVLCEEIYQLQVYVEELPLKVI